MRRSIATPTTARLGDRPARQVPPHPAPPAGRSPARACSRSAAAGAASPKWPRSDGLQRHRPHAVAGPARMGAAARAAAPTCACRTTATSTSSSTTSSPSRCSRRSASAGGRPTSRRVGQGAQARRPGGDPEHHHPRRPVRRLPRGTDFIQHYIFPGGMLPSRAAFRAAAAEQGLVGAGRIRLRRGLRPHPGRMAPRLRSATGRRSPRSASTSASAASGASTSATARPASWPATSMSSISNSRIADRWRRIARCRHRVLPRLTRKIRPKMDCPRPVVAACCWRWRAAPLPPSPTPTRPPACNAGAAASSAASASSSTKRRCGPATIRNGRRWPCA